MPRPSAPPSCYNPDAPKRAVNLSLNEDLVQQARRLNPEVATGIFAADMKVHLVNDGPITIPLRMV